MANSKLKPDALSVLMSMTPTAAETPTVEPSAAARRKSGGNRDKHVQLLLTAELYEAFKEAAAAQGVSFNQLANEALEAFIEK